MKNSGQPVKLIAVSLLALLAIGAVVSMSGPASSSNGSSTPSQASSSPLDTSQLAAAEVTPDLTKTDPTIFLDPVPLGKKAPDFKATTATGKPISLSQFKGKENVVLVFYQGSFCTVCGQQLQDLQANLDKFKSRHTQVIAISGDDPTHARKSVADHGLTFPVIPDTSKSIIKSFGVANITRNNIAWPAAFLVDKKGLIRLSFADSRAKRLYTKDFLPIIDALGKS